MSDPDPTLADEVVSLAAELLAHAAPEGTPLVAAVSGGADSVALAMTLARLTQRWPLRAVAFVDHGLRDVSADRAAALAAAQAAGVGFIERRVTLGEGTGNLQARARAERYRALLAVAAELDPRALVATGHTRSDQAETVLSRLLRGAGIAGLSALAPRRGRLVRPLLPVSRALTRALGLPFHDDPSNATGRFQRNRLRVVLEALGAEQPAIEVALAHLADAARGATLLLDAVALAAPDTSLTGLDDAAARAFAAHLLRNQGARGPRRETIAAFAAALVDGGASSVSLGDGLRGVARGGRAAVVDDDDPRRAVVAWRPGTYRGPSLELEMTELSLDAADVAPAEPPAEPMNAQSCVAWVPAADVVWPVRLRPTRRGRPGVLGDEIDLETGERLGGWRVEDGSGRTLVPSAGLPPAHGAGAHSRPESRWVRIVLRSCSPARATNGCEHDERSATQVMASRARARRRDGRLG